MLLHEALTYCLVQQLLLNQLQHGLWAEKRTHRGRGLKSYPVPQEPRQREESAIPFLVNTS